MYNKTLARAILALGTVASLASAHMIMIEPHSYNLNTEPLAQSWPLSADLPFPCQGRTQHAEEITNVTAGAAQTVKFMGSAIHGGGTCQFSVAYGDQPPKDPKDWKTIYTIYGGCPGETTGLGNLATVNIGSQGRPDGPHCDNDHDTECVRDFHVPIPKELKNGRAVFAWTWFNKVGNREMYMNCAPVDIQGGTGDDAFISALPSVFIANAPGGQCDTVEGPWVQGVPNPGKFGQVYGTPDFSTKGSCPAHGGIPDTFIRGARGDAGGASSSQGAGTQVTASPPVPDTATTGHTATTSETGHNFITKSPGPAVASTQSPSASPSTSPVTASPSSKKKECTARPPSTVTSQTTLSTSSPTVSVSGSTSGGPTLPPLSPSPLPQSILFTTAASPASSSFKTVVVSGSTSASAPPPTAASIATYPHDPKAVACPVSGALVCLQPGFFGICNNGWAVPQQLAAEQGCSNGTIGFASPTS